MAEIKFFSLLILVIMIRYAWSCLFRPFRDCRWCKARGKFSWGTLHRLCWWCGGKGMKLRYGRRAWNYFAKVRKAAKRKKATA